MSLVLKTSEQLRDHQEELRARYMVSGIGNALSDIYEMPVLFMHRLDMEARFTEFLKNLEQSNGPDRLFFDRLLNQSWLSVCRPYEVAERIEIIKSCLHRVDPSTEQLSEPSIERVLMILNAEPALWKSCNGYFVIGMCEGEESIVEICVNEGGKKAPIVFQDFSDDYLRECLIWSWSFTPDQRIAQNARAQIMKELQTAWGIHRKVIQESFDEYAFATCPRDQLALNGALVVNEMWVWKKLPLVLEFGDLDTDTVLRNPASRQKCYSIPEIWENTEKLRDWLKKAQANGYPTLSEECWTLKRIENEHDEPLKLKWKLWEQHPPERTLKRVLVDAMRVLKLDQAFFGKLLITHRAYLQQMSDQS